MPFVGRHYGFYHLVLALSLSVLIVSPISTWVVVSTLITVIYILSLYKQWGVPPLPVSPIHHGDVTYKKMSPINRTIFLSAGFTGFSMGGNLSLWNSFLSLDSVSLPSGLLVFFVGCGAGAFSSSVILAKLKNKVVLYLNLVFLLTLTTLFIHSLSSEQLVNGQNLSSLFLNLFAILSLFFGFSLGLIVSLITLDEDTAPQVNLKVFVLQWIGLIFGAGLTTSFLIPLSGLWGFLVSNFVLLVTFLAILYHGFLYQEYRVAGPIKFVICLTQILWIVTNNT